MQYGYVHLFVNYSIQFVSVLSNTIPINPVEILYGNGSKTIITKIQGLEWYVKKFLQKFFLKIHVNMKY